MEGIVVRRIKTSDLRDLFVLAKQSLKEKGIENIRDDLLMIGLKNALSKKLVNIDFGVFKDDEMIGFAFLEVFHLFYLQQPTAKLENIYLTLTERTEENYLEILYAIMDVLESIDIKILNTADNWTLCNDCEILDRAMKQYPTYESKKTYKVTR